MMSNEEPNRVWHYFIDSDGHLWHDGSEFDDPAVLNLFMKNMTSLPNGRCHVFCQGEECLITSEDVPYVVQDVEFAPREIRLKFPGGYTEILNPSTLFVGERNVLYCRVRDGKFTARFNRKSYLDLAKRVECDDERGEFTLTVDNRRYPIKGVRE